MNRTVTTMPKFTRLSVSTTSLDLNHGTDIYWTFLGVFNLPTQCIRIMDKGDICNPCRITMGHFGPKILWSGAIARILNEVQRLRMNTIVACKLRELIALIKLS
jgi:hypothetical protein